MKETDLAYTAGYIDGDGCFHLRKASKKFFMSLIISSTDTCIINWFASIYGGRVNEVMYKKRPENHRKVFHFCIRMQKAIPMINKILPYLVEKRTEAEICINFSIAPKNKRWIEVQKLKSIKRNENLVFHYEKELFEKERNTIVPTEVDYAYLSGFIDAECCLNIQKYRSKDRENFLYKIQLQCNNSKSPCFKWLLTRFGGRIHFIGRKEINKNHRDQFCWRLTSRSLAKILPKILPYLRHKRPVCKKIIEFYETTLPNGGARHTDKFRSMYQSVLIRREAIVQQIHVLNQKGFV